MKKTVLALTLAGIGSMAHAVSYEESYSFAGWLAAAEAIGPTTLGTGTFVAVSQQPTVAKVQGVAGLSFAQVGNGFTSFLSPPASLNNVLSSGGYLEWTLPSAQSGFGGNFFIPEKNSGLKFVVNDVNLGWIDVCTAACIGAAQAVDGFYGFTSTSRFTGVRVFAGPDVGDGVGTNYRMFDVSIAQAVPEPSTYVMMVLGLLSVGAGASKRTARQG